MVRFARALLDGTLLEPAYVDLLVGAKFPVVTMPARPGAPGRPPLPRQSLYEAYGPAAYLANGSWWMGHNGGSPGISTDVSWYPSQGWVAVMLSNYDPQDTAIVANTIHGILQ
jgi:CubicO group peptidase (beta-lactamase class C family)